MRRNKRDKNMPIGRLKKVTDFIPHPEKLVVPKKTKQSVHRTHIGSNFDDFLKEEGILEEVQTAAARKCRLFKVAK